MNAFSLNTIRTNSAMTVTVPKQSDMEKIQARKNAYSKTTAKYRSRLDQVLSAVTALESLANARGLEFHTEGVRAVSQRSKKSTAYNIHCRIGTGELIPTISFRDSLNGESSTSIDFGVYRMVCKNGLHVASSKYQIDTVRHTGDWSLTESQLVQLIDQAQTCLEATVSKYAGQAVSESIYTAKSKVLLKLVASGLITEFQASIAIKYPIYTHDIHAGLFGLVNTVQESLTTNRNRTKKTTAANAELNRKLLPAIDLAIAELFPIAA